MEAVGLTLGFIGLAGMFTTCVDCFKLVQIYRSRSSDFDTLQTMLDNQQFHLMAWGRACGFMDITKPNQRFDDRLAAARNRQIEKTMDSIHHLLTDTDKLRKRFGMRPHRAAPGVAMIEAPTPSAFEKVFQNTRDFWNTSLQRKTHFTGAVSWTVHDREKFSEMIEHLRSLIEDLAKFTEDMDISASQDLIVEYEIEMIGDESSLEAISEAQAGFDSNDTISAVARRKLERVKERSTIAPPIGPDDSVSVFREPLPPSLDPISDTDSTVVDDDRQSAEQAIGIHRVPDDQWRKVKTGQGLMRWLPTLIVSEAPRVTNDAERASANNQGTAHQTITRVAINSTSLLDTLRTTTKSTISVQNNVIVYPFKLLVEHESQIKACLHTLSTDCGKIDPVPEPDPEAPSSEESDASNADETSASQARVQLFRRRDELALLVEFMDQEICAYPQSIESICFHELWSVFRRAKVLLDQDGEMAYIPMRVYGGQRVLDASNNSQSRHNSEGDSILEPLDGTRQSIGQAYTDFTVICAFLDCDGFFVGPHLQKFTVPYYSGGRSPKELPVLPSDLREDNYSILERLETRGHRFLAAMKGRYFNYCGPALGEWEPGHASKCRVCRTRLSYATQLDDKVIIDHEAALSAGAQTDCSWRVGIQDLRKTISLPRDRRDMFEFVNCSDPLCTKCSDVYDENSQVHSPLDGSAADLPLGVLGLSTIDEVVKSPYLDRIIPCFNRRVCGYSIATREWLALNLEYTEPTLWRQDDFKDLVLEPWKKNMLLAIVQSQMNIGDSPGNMRNKIRGGLLLFHGAPGVGKTFAAEAISSQLQVPLISISASELGTTAQDVRVRMTGFLSLAQRWRCVVVIEDADVLVGQRSLRDVAAAGVALALVQLFDSFSGLIILITSRVGQFDASLTSRIRMAIFFPALNTDTILEVFRTDLRRLEQDRDLDIDVSQIMEYVKDNIETLNKRSHIDGRQIRSACESAAALAAYQRKRIISRLHIKAVLEASQEFDSYLSLVNGFPDEKVRTRGRHSDSASWDETV